MKTIFLTIISLAICHVALCQSQVISTTSSGGNQLQEDQIILDFSIGQAFVELKTDNDQDITYQEGIFHASLETIVSQILNTGLEIQDMELYPNPTTEYFILRTPEKATGVISIYDMKGSLVRQIRDYQDAQRIEMHGTVAGTYSVIFESGNVYGLSRFVKME